MKERVKAQLGIWWFVGLLFPLLLLFIQSKWESAPLLFDVITSVVSWIIFVPMVIWVIIGVLQIIIAPFQFMQKEGIKKFAQNVLQWFISFVIPAILLLLFMYAIARSIIL